MLQFWRGMREGGAGKAKERANDGRDVARGRGGLCGCQIVRRGVLWKGRIVLIFWELFWRKMERSGAAVRVVGRNVSEPVLDDQGAPFDRGEGIEGDLLPGEHRREERGGRTAPRIGPFWRGMKAVRKEGWNVPPNPRDVEASHSVEGRVLESNCGQECIAETTMWAWSGPNRCRKSQARI